MRNRIRRNIEWFLCTDFETHEPLDRDLVKAVLLLIVICIIIGGLS
jgi:hypothetical protein